MPLHGLIPGSSDTCVSLLTGQWKYHHVGKAGQETKKQKDWAGREEGEKEARIGYILTFTANKFDTILTYLFIVEYILTLYFGFHSMHNKYKMENIQRG